jgi:hypothetical protein
MTTGKWPGSYSGGDNARGIWQVTGSHYKIRGIVFRGGTDGAANGSGLRFKGADTVTVTACLFDHNDNGIQGAGTNTVVEFSELTANGDPALTEGQHNVYIQGGSVAIRYSYIHDAAQGQNLHIRANDATLEYNFVARPKRYQGDMMTCTDGTCSGTQHLLLRGNVFIRGTPTNDAQEFVLYDDQGAVPVSFVFTAIDNTFIGNGDGAALVHLANSSGAVQTETGILQNNAIVNMNRGKVFSVDAPGTTNTTVSGTNNWVTTGMDTTGLAASVSGADPGFVDMANGNFLPAKGSPLVGAAATMLPNLPDKEYYRDEKVVMMWRPRLSARDIGAFESTTTSTPVSVDGPVSAGAGGSAATDAGRASGGRTASPLDSGPSPTGGAPTSAEGGGAGKGTGAMSALEGGPAPNGPTSGTRSAGGCGCRTAARRDDRGLAALFAAWIVFLFAMRERVRQRRVGGAPYTRGVPFSNAPSASHKTLAS